MRIENDWHWEITPFLFVGLGLNVALAWYVGPFALIQIPWLLWGLFRSRKVGE